MGDGELPASGRGGRVWATLAVMGVLGLMGVATASGSWTAGEPRVDFGQTVAATPPSSPRPTPTLPNGASTIDEYGATCDRVADRILQTNNNTMNTWDRQEVLACMADRLEGRTPATAPGAVDADDLANYFNVIIRSDKRQLVIFSEGPLPPSALVRIGPIPSGFSIVQRTDALSRARLDTMVRKADEAIERALGDRADVITATINPGYDGRSIDVSVSDERLACDGDGNDPVPDDAELAVVKRAALPAFPGLDVRVDGVANCLPKAGG